MQGTIFTARFTTAARLGLGLAAALWVALPAPAIDRIPAELEGVDIVEHLDARLPLDLEFTDEQGRAVRLSEYFDGKGPVILTLNYYRCPGMCTYELSGLIDGLKELEWSPAKEFRIVTVSFAPEETHELARVKKESYLLHYDRGGAAEGWHFLTGSQDNITTLLETVGKGVRKQPDGEYAHAAGVIMCTPDGRVSRYLYGILYRPKDLRLALVEAGEGKVGSAFDRFLLWCHRYDPDSRGYVKSAIRIMRLGGALTLVALATGLFVLWRLDFLQSRRHRAGASAESHGARA